MGISKQLKARLARLEASVDALPDPQAERERERLGALHWTTWVEGNSFEDLPEKDRDPQLWDTYCRYGRVFLEMIEEGLLDGSEELPATGINFAREEGIDEDTVRDPTNRTSEPNTPDEP